MRYARLLIDAFGLKFPTTMSQSSLDAFEEHEPAPKVGIYWTLVLSGLSIWFNISYIGQLETSGLDDPLFRLFQGIFLLLGMIAAVWAVVSVYMRLSWGIAFNHLLAKTDLSRVPPEVLARARRISSEAGFYQLAVLIEYDHELPPYHRDDDL